MHKIMISTWTRFLWSVAWV